MSLTTKQDKERVQVNLKSVLPMFEIILLNKGTAWAIIEIITIFNTTFCRILHAYASFICFQDCKLLSYPTALSTCSWNIIKSITSCVFCLKVFFFCPTLLLLDRITTCNYLMPFSCRKFELPCPLRWEHNLLFKEG